MGSGIHFCSSATTMKWQVLYLIVFFNIYSKGHSNKISITDKPQHVPDSTPLYSKKDADVHRAEASTWGRGLYKTFDNRMFTFESLCNYTFCRHCIESGREFNIEMSRNAEGKIDRLSVVLDGNDITVKDGKIFVNAIKVQVPYDNKMLRIKRYGLLFKLVSRRGVLTLLWNNEDKISLILHKKYDTCGLCGDSHTIIGTNITQLIADSKILDNTCPEPSVEQHLHCAEGQMYCQNIITKYFKQCKTVGNLYSEYERICTEEYCRTGNRRDVCPTFFELARECSSEGSGPYESWRSDQDVVCATPACPQSEIYQDCVPPNKPTCSYMSPYQDGGCVSGCICPEGYVLDDIGGSGECTAKRNCACKFNGKVYSPGEVRKGTCNSQCTCHDARWECTESLCPGRCEVEGSFITTFDGSFYSFAGDCHFMAIQDKDWSLSVEIRPCFNGPAETCLKSVTLSLGPPVSADKYIFHSNGSFFNAQIHHDDYYASDTINIFRLSSSYIRVSTFYGLYLLVQFGPVMQFYASLPAKQFTNTQGLCGSFNNKAEDDFLSSQNILEVTPEAFASSWEMMTCPKARHPSCTSIEKERFAKENCGLLIDPNGVFASGHFTVDHRSYYERCLISTCVCENVKDCLCTALGNYVKACAKHGIYITDWRKGICEEVCKEGMVFQYNAKACNTSCRSLSEKDLSCDVENIPVDGCICPKDRYLNSKGECVEQDVCDCYMDNQVLTSGQSIQLGSYMCVCKRGQILCHDPFDLSPVTCTGGAEFVSCSDPNAKKRIDRTCSALKMPQFSMDLPCKRGCFCPLGMVRNSNGVCIPAVRCPCSYSGRTYKQGSSIKVECNTCTCVQGSWKCTENKCQSTCHIYGDGQIQTFDGKWYSYDGLCQYVLAEDYCGKEDGSFQILTESVPCCDDGVTCSRKITVILEKASLVLEDGKVMFIKDAGSTQCETDEQPYVVHTVGLYLIIKFSYGIILIWDKNTRLTLIKEPNWSSNVCGLCGNHNGNLQDEFTTRQGSLAAGPLEFGDSWKTGPECSDTVVESFPCDANAYCRDWAVRKCEIIRDYRFRACHNRVDPTPYHKACIEEACACTMEGKYLGFCTAIAMYAEACAAVGVCVSWRTPDLCPVYCDYYNAPGQCSWHYEPCGTVTAKTCKDQVIGRTLPSVLEGCYAKCPKKTPYLDENTMKCVRLKDCSCYYNDVIIAGQSIYDDCGRFCVCKAGKLVCSSFRIPELGVTPTLKKTETTKTTKGPVSTNIVLTTGKEFQQDTSGLPGVTQVTRAGWNKSSTGTTSESARVRGSTEAVRHTSTETAEYPEPYTHRAHTKHTGIGSTTEGMESITTEHVASTKHYTGIPSRTPPVFGNWTGVTSRVTERVGVGSSTEGMETVSMEGFGSTKRYTGIPPRTPPAFGSRTSVTSRVTTRIGAGSSTERMETVSMEGFGSTKRYTGIPPRTPPAFGSWTSVTSRVTERVGVGSSTEGMETVSMEGFGSTKRYSGIPPRTPPAFGSRTSVTSRVTERVGAGSSTEGMETVSMEGFGSTKRYTGIPPRTLPAFGSWTGVTSRVTEGVGVGSSTEGMQTVSMEGFGSTKRYTGIPPRTLPAFGSRTSVTSRVTEHVGAGSSTDGMETVSMEGFGSTKRYTGIPPRTLPAFGSRTSVTSRVTERVGVGSSTEGMETVSMEGFGSTKRYTGIPPRTLPAFGSWTGVTSRVTEGVGVGSSTEGMQTVSMEGFGSTKRYTGIPPRTLPAFGSRTSVTSRVTEHVGAGSSTDGMETVSMEGFGSTKRYTGIPPRTLPAFGSRTSVTSRVTERVGVGSSTEGMETVSMEGFGSTKRYNGIPPRTPPAFRNRTSVTSRVTERVGVGSSMEGMETVSMEGFGSTKHYTGIPPRTLPAFGNWTGVTSRVTERVGVGSSTERMQTVSMEGFGSTKRYTGIPSRTPPAFGSRTSVTSRVTERVGVGSSTEGMETVSMEGFGATKHYTGIPPRTLPAFGNWTGVTSRVTERVGVGSSTERMETVSMEGFGSTKHYTGIPPRTLPAFGSWTGVTSRVTERIGAGGSTERMETVSMEEFGSTKHYTAIPPRTPPALGSRTGVTSRVTERVSAGSSTEGLGSITGYAKRSTGSTEMPIVGITGISGATESTENLTESRSWPAKAIYSTGVVERGGSTAWPGSTGVSTKSTRTTVTEFTEGVQEGFSTTTNITIGERPAECPTVPEPTSCRFRNKYYKIGEMFEDPQNPCLQYSCSEEGFTTKVMECLGQKWCGKEHRIYHANKCCYDCVNECRPVPLKMEVSAKGCKGYILMARCTGECKNVISFSKVDHQMTDTCFCCKATDHIYKNASIPCPGGRLETYRYKHIVACHCQACQGS